ncbi:carboxylesterase 18 [Spatholobus suberectus]|nr:carboxylesterase 18 [Spatholobus suberectus]
MATATTKPTLPWKVRLSVSLLSTLSDASRRSHGTINRRLFNLADRPLPPNPAPLDGVSSSDFTVDPARNLWTDWHWKVFLPNGSDRDHEAVNVSGPNAVDILDLDYPNTIVFMGGFDPLRDWQKRYYEWLRKSRKEVQLIDYPNTFHAFYLFPELPETSLFISEVKEFMSKQMSNVN